MGKKSHNINLCIFSQASVCAVTSGALPLGTFPCSSRPPSLGMVVPLKLVVLGSAGSQTRHSRDSLLAVLSQKEKAREAVRRLLF